MNFIQKMAFKAAMTLAPAAASLGRNALFRSVYQYMGQGLPIWMDTNSESYISKAYAYNADVYSIVNYIITSAATIPWKLSKVNKDGSLEQIKDHEILRLLERPNPMQGQAAFMEALLGYKLVTGNSYVYAPRLDNGANAGKTRELYVMPSHLTEIVFGSAADPVGGYKVNGFYSETIEPSNVMHLKYWNPMVVTGSDLYGLSPIQAAARLVTQSNDSFAAQTRAFQNMGAVGILMKEDDQQATEEQMRQIKDKYQEEYTGNNAMKVMLTTMRLRWQQMGLSPVDLNILESQKLTFLKLCNIYKFPSVLLNSKEASTYNNMVEARKAFYTDCVLPELYHLRDELNMFLLKRRLENGQLENIYGEELWLEPDTSGIEVLQDNKKEMVEWLAKAYWVKLVDKQRIMGLEEDETLDYYADANGVPLVTPEEAQERVIEAAGRAVNQAARQGQEEEEEALKALARLGVGTYSSNGHSKHN